MDNMRERLIESLRECIPQNVKVKFCGDTISVNIAQGNIADHLIANGVTVQQWIPVTESLPIFYPERRRAVLVTMKDSDGKFFTTTAKYNEEHKEWYEFSDRRFREFEVVALMTKPDAYRPEEK